MLNLTDGGGRHGLPAIARSNARDLRPDSPVGAISWDLVRPKPYDLVFRNPTDVICLLFGTIEAKTGYDGARPSDMRFEALSAAFHPRNGEVAVSANRISGGFLAFTFPPTFRESMFGDDAEILGGNHSVDNIQSPAIASLVAYARTAMATERADDALCAESLACLAYTEAMRGMRALRDRRRSQNLSSRDATRLFAYIEENLAEPLSLADLAKTVDLPIATLRRQFHQCTGRSVHQFIIERRLQLACDLLKATHMAIPQIAAASGFSSQQHMTMAFTNRLGVTPKVFQQQNGGS
jgi:AraC family transcriptional regulator